jgi:hypothetical protein
MGEPDMKGDMTRATLRREEAELAEFFDAERATPASISAVFLEAVVADAMAMNVSRAKTLPPRPSRRHGLAAVLRPLGGWLGATAIAGCAALGFWAGAIGTGSGLMAETLWSDFATIDAQADGVAGFYELGEGEG